MEGLTRLVADSFARHGLDRPVDPRRLQWSRWFRCDSPHSLLVVPSKPGIFALAEEIMELGASNGYVGTDAFVRPVERSSAVACGGTDPAMTTTREGHGLTPALSEPSELKGAKTAANKDAALAADGKRRMLAITQFFEDDDMAFTLDRMFTRINPMRERLASGRCFLRFVVIEDHEQRRSICAALNQWMVNSAEKATGISTDFQSPLELTPTRVSRTLPSASSELSLSFSKGQALSDSVDTISKATSAQPPKPEIAASLNLGAAKNLHCPHPLPSGF